MIQKYSLTKILKNSYKVLDSSWPISIEEAFEQEGRLREMFNIECVNFIDSVCENSEKTLLPKYYSVKSILSEILVNLLNAHNKNRIKILKITKITIKPLIYIKGQGDPVRYKIMEEKFFVFLSAIFILAFCIKRLLINVATTFIKLELARNNNENSTHYLFCIGFPWYAYIEHKDAESIHISRNKFFGLADYIRHLKLPKNTSVISIGEYHLDRWGSSPELHEDIILDKSTTFRRFANPIVIIKQIRRQFTNTANALKFISSLKITNLLDKCVLLLSALRYYTDSVDTQEFIQNFTNKSSSITLLYNSNSFYTFPWYASTVEDKSHYMYSDNCCYFPFAYFSPSINVNHTPKPIEDDMLFYGFLGWPIYNRIVGEKDIGYQGVSRLSHSINKITGNISTVINEEHPFQLGSIQRFSTANQKKHADKLFHIPGKKSVFFLDGTPCDAKSLLPLFDVPATFLTPEVALVYYDSLFDLIKVHDITIYIRPKYRAGNDLIKAIRNFQSKNNDYVDRIVIVSSKEPLQDIITSINPSVILIKPMSSTHLFLRALGYQPHFYLPQTLRNILDKMIELTGLPNPNKQGDWVSENELNFLLRDCKYNENNY